MEEGERGKVTPFALLMRDDDWLAAHLDYVWDRYFADTPRANHVDIGFSKRWKARLGLITLCEPADKTIIRLNGLLSLPVVPECINTVTIAHEMVHYARGFGSPLPCRHKHPHHGNIIEKELLSRGLGTEYDRYLDWIDGEWDAFYQANARAPRRLWLPRQSGATFVGVADDWREAAATLRQPRPAVPEETAQEN